MSCVSIQDLAVSTGGRLRLGVLPPLGGVWEPIRRIQFELDQLHPGDIYWQLSSEAEHSHAAYARGALGIVHEGGRIEPWAGRFSLQVRCAPHALRLAAMRSRRNYAGCVVALLEMGHTLARSHTTSEFLDQLRQWAPASGHCEAGQLAEMACEIIHLDERRPYSVFSLSRQPIETQFSCVELFGANVVVACRAVAGKLNGRAGEAKIICCDDYRSLSELVRAVLEAGQQSQAACHCNPCVALPSMADLRESGMPTLLGRSDKLADRWLLGQSPGRVLPGRA